MRWSLVMAAMVAGAAAAQQAPGERYVLEPGDVLEVRFHYTPEMNERAPIGPDGYFSLPLIGHVMVAGKRIPDLVSELEQRYAKILRQPAIAVQVHSYANRKVFVGGEVLRPGLINLVGEQTVLGAILEAGGVTKAAKTSHVLLVRRSASGAPETLKIALPKTWDLSAQAASFQLRPYDVILVPESGIVRANRLVEQYVFRFVPPQISFGFTYLLNHGILF